MTDFYDWDGNDLILRVRIQPRASRDEWLGPRGERLCLRISSPPVDGQANSRSREFLAKTFQIAPSRVVLISGDASRNKRFRIHSPRLLPSDIKPAPSP